MRKPAPTKKASSPKRKPDQPPRYGRGTGVPHPVDVHVGMRVWQSRRLRGMTQAHLAEQLDLTFQQVQKYETGANRISASRLAAIAELLELPIGFFFAELAPADSSIASAQQYRDRLLLPETIDLIRYFGGINDLEIKKTFLALVQAAAASGPIHTASGGHPPTGTKRPMRRLRNPKE